MKISVIIPTYNEGRVLEKCLESLGAQTYPDFEIIVVDDGSADGIKDTIGNLKFQIPNFKFLEQKHEGAGAARNLGAKSAKGEILVFVDADMTFDKDFLKRLVAPIIEGKAQGTFSKEEYVANWGNLWARCWNVNEGWEDRRRHPKNYPDHQPVFRAVLRNEFERVAGFTPGGYNDDWSLSRKLGYEAINAPGAIFYHKNPSSLSEIFKQARWVGKREYKLGYLGYLGALGRVSLPASLVVGLYKSLIILNFKFLIFKLTYDFGIFVGVIEMLLTGRQAK